MPAAPGQVLSPLDGIPTPPRTATWSRPDRRSGSPAFKDLVAQRDAFTIERLRAAGAICLGKTNMPPMANGGMQRGVYGRAESPYNANYLTAPFASGSSNGAGTAAASFSAFGLAEETWSSGRGPASNNGLCAYTPARGDFGARQLAADPDHGRGGAYAAPWPTCWKCSTWWSPTTPTPRRPVAPATLGADSGSLGAPGVPGPAVDAGALKGKRFGVPRMYINADEAGTSETGIGGPTGQRINTRATVIDLWKQARQAWKRPVPKSRSGLPAGVQLRRRPPGRADRVQSRHRQQGVPARRTVGAVRLGLRRLPARQRRSQAQPPGRCRWAADLPHDPGTLPNREGDLAAGMDEYVNMAKRGLEDLGPDRDRTTACALERPASWTWKTGWTGSSSTPCCSRPSPTSARPTPT
jgi:amidase